MVNKPLFIHLLPVEKLIFQPLKCLSNTLSFHLTMPLNLKCHLDLCVAFFATVIPFQSNMDVHVSAAHPFAVHHFGNLQTRPAGVAGLFPPPFIFLISRLLLLGNTSVTSVQCSTLSRLVLRVFSFFDAGVGAVVRRHLDFASVSSQGVWMSCQICPP